VLTSVRSSASTSDAHAATLFSDAEAGSGAIDNEHVPNHGRGRHLRRLNLVRQSRRVHIVHGVLPTGCLAGWCIYRDEGVPDVTSKFVHKLEGSQQGHDHTYFLQLSRDVFAV
jgi:hypothetical protein